MEVSVGGAAPKAPPPEETDQMAIQAAVEHKHTTPVPSKPKTEQPKPTTGANAGTTAAKPTAKAEPKPKTPEQQAAGLRREAGELRRSAKAIGETSEAGRGLVVLADNKEHDADALSPRKGKSTEARPTCIGTKKDGSACSAKAMEGSEFCTDHRPVELRFSADQKAAFGRIAFATLVDRLGWGVALKMANEQIAKEKSEKPN